MAVKRELAGTSREGSPLSKPPQGEQGHGSGPVEDAKSQKSPDWNHSLAGELLSDSEHRVPLCKEWKIPE